MGRRTNQNSAQPHIRNKGYEHMHVSLVETLRATEPVVSVILVMVLMPSDRPTGFQCLCLLPIVLGARPGMLLPS